MPAVSMCASALRLSSDQYPLLPEPHERWLESEWLETDGLGGYACSTALGLASRRYHGWLTAVPVGSVRRHLFLSRLDETLSFGVRRASLGVARFADGIAARDLGCLRSFSARPWPRTSFAVGEAQFERELLLLRGRRTLLVRYSLEGHFGDEGDGQIGLSLRPLHPCREVDRLTYRNEALDPAVSPLAHGYAFRPYPALPAVELDWGSAPAQFQADPTWYQGLAYELDRARGYESVEDNFTPGRIELQLAPGEAVVFAVSLDELEDSPEALWQRETEVRLAAAPAHGSPVELARASARDYLYRMPIDAGGEPGEVGPATRLGILAGFPWFGEWGRDVFIALPGLTLAQGGVKECEQVLRGALPFLVDGMLPNIYGRGPADSHYGSADASLWFARALRMWSERSPELELLRDEFLPALESIAEGYSSGSGEAGRLGLFVDAEGLLHAGRADLNPTWMDARTEAGPVTPRAGRPVELNALWYSLLALLEELHLKFRNMSRSKEFGDRRRLARRHFLARFWIAEERYLADLIEDGDRLDTSVRPNMLIAAAEPASPLRKQDRQAIVERSRAELLTPFGLRTLSPADPAYIGRYEGGGEERDGAYHQGTVWPWLLGFHVEAELRAFGSNRAQREQLAGLWSSLEQELWRGGLGHLAEVYDGDAPQRAGGTFGQAWSLSEYLRSMDLLSRNLR